MKISESQGSMTKIRSTHSNYEDDDDENFALEVLANELVLYEYLRC